MYDLLYRNAPIKIETINFVWLGADNENMDGKNLKDWEDLVNLKDKTQ